MAKAYLNQATGKFEMRFRNGQKVIWNGTMWINEDGSNANLDNNFIHWYNKKGGSVIGKWEASQTAKTTQFRDVRNTNKQSGLKLGIIAVCSVILICVLALTSINHKQLSIASENTTNNIITTTKSTIPAQTLSSPSQIQAECLAQVNSYLSNLKYNAGTVLSPASYKITNSTLFYDSNGTNINLWISNHSVLYAAQTIFSTPTKENIDCLNSTITSNRTLLNNLSATPLYVCIDFYELGNNFENMTAMGVAFSTNPPPSFTENGLIYTMSSMSLLCNSSGDLMPSSKLFINRYIYPLIENTEQRG